MNNYAFPFNNASQYVSTLCTVVIHNASQVDQKLTSFKFFFSTTKYSAATTTGYTRFQDLSLIGHKSVRSQVAEGFNVFWFIYPGATPASGQTTKSGPYTPNEFTNASGLSSSTPSEADLPAGATGVFMARTTHEDRDVVAPGGTSIVERKTFNLCSGAFVIEDDPSGAQPQIGFIVSTGSLEYIADSPTPIQMVMGSATQDSRILSILDPYNTYALSESGGRIWSYAAKDMTFRQISNVPPYNEITPEQQSLGTCGCACDARAHTRTTMRTQCVNLNKFYTTESLGKPQHIASIPILVNGGNPL